MRLISVILIASVAVILSACNRSNESPTQTPIDEVVRTTSAPIDALTRQIVGGLVPVELLCPQVQDPATWRPDPETVSQYQRARLIVSNGAGYEQWVQTAPLPRSRLIEAADAITEPLVKVKGETHSHGPGGYHTHEVVLGHVWLDPIHVIAQAQAITKGLVVAFPQHEVAFNDQLNELITSLRELDRQISDVDLRGIEILAPSTPYGYLTQRYQWQAAELSDDAADWSMNLYARKLSEGAGDGSAIIILSEQLPDDEIIETLIQTHNARVCLWENGSTDIDGSYSQMLSENIGRIISIIRDLNP